MTTTTFHQPIAPSFPVLRGQLGQPASGVSVGAALSTAVRFLGHLAAAAGTVLVLGTDAEH